MYEEEEYDVAGFAVGIAEKSKLVTGSNIQEGDMLIGLASNGLHSNGYSLVRRIMIEQAKLELDRIYEPLTVPLGEELLKPTRIYVKPLLQVMKQFDIKGMAHITGGGFIENIPRMLPEGLGAEIDDGSWPVPPIFDLLREKGNLERGEMFSIFNMGIGMVLAVDREVADRVSALFTELGEKAYVIGRVKRGKGVSFVGGAMA